MLGMDIPTRLWRLQQSEEAMNGNRPASQQRFLNLALLLLLALGLLATACGESNGSGSTGGDVEPEASITAAEPTATQAPGPTSTEAPQSTATSAPVATRSDPPDLGEAETVQLVDGLNGFAGDLYHQVIQHHDGNLIYSPYSIGLAFAMLYAGARSETEAQMADVLGFLPQEEQHPAANALDQYLASLGEDTDPASEELGEAFQLSVANGLWTQQGFPFLDAFLQTLAEHYGAGIEMVDFVSDAEAVRQVINAWVEEKTEGRITEVIPPDVLNEMTRLVLANAIYFKANWLQPFDEMHTQDEPFTLLDSSQVQTPMMRATLDIPYHEGEGYQAVLMPYVGHDVAMTVIVPDAGRFEEIETGLSGELIDEVAASAEIHEVVLGMPRFDFESDLDLKQLLEAMGMADPFRSSRADFSGISEEGLFVSAAIHRANITVDEEGTEAAAVTIIVAEATSGSEVEPLRLTIDRPFIFAITERETGAILFLGRVSDPSN